MYRRPVLNHQDSSKAKGSVIHFMNLLLIMWRNREFFENKKDNHLVFGGEIASEDGASMACSKFRERLSAPCGQSDPSTAIHHRHEHR
jgi:hypothetical protein